MVTRRAGLIVPREGSMTWIQSQLARAACQMQAHDNRHQNDGPRRSEAGSRLAAGVR